MKKILMMLVGLTVAMTSGAQDETGTWTLTPKIGLNWAKMSDSGIWYGPASDEKASPKGKLGITVGAEAEYRVLSGLGLSAGLLYSQQGTGYEDAPGLWKDMTLNLDYLNLPLMAHLYVAPGLSLSAGLQPGYLVHRKTSVTELVGDGITTGWESSSSDTSYHRDFDFGIPVGIAYDLDNLRIELRYCLGLYDTTKYDLKERNRTAQLSVGYRFSL
ncbi:MAG: PorT family protein [Prevotella sp.]|nr:PorT family protein [Prevotella sp.]